MSFSTALSGLAAASNNLNVIGNNIANSSTTGFKASRVEFGDVYAASTFGTGTTPIGSGVQINNIRQVFNQGNISTTNNSLDLAISGNGFFTVSDQGARKFTRAGMFGLDKDGFMINSAKERLQGFTVTSTGAVSGTLADLQIDTSNQQPARTTEVTANLNLNAADAVRALRGATYEMNGAVVAMAQLGTSNGYPAGSVQVDNSTTGTFSVVSNVAGESAQSYATKFAAIPGVVATATSRAQVTGFNNGASTVTLNGVTITGSTPAQFAASINNLTGTTLAGITASVSGGTVTVVSNNGADLRFGINASGTGADTLTVQGMTDATTPTGAALTISGAAGGSVTVGGVVHLDLPSNLTLSNGTGALFPASPVGTPYVRNTFDPSDPNTYNSSTSATVYDSLGNSHKLTKYFVKEPTPNTWTMYAQIDDMDVGDPNAALPPPQDTQPTRAAYALYFNPDGTLNTAATPDILISNWTPLDANGSPNGAVTGQPVASGGTLPIPSPPTSSNFEIDLGNTTQFGSPFSVNALTQNGYTTGRLTGVDVSKDGFVFARYTNGQSRVLGQVALANFPNAEGLKPQGNTAWAETFDSGQPTFGAPGSSSLGLLNAGALEDSTVDLSQELVHLITAQRDYQANAKTVQTEDTITQTIINLR